MNIGLFKIEDNKLIQVSTSTLGVIAHAEVNQQLYNQSAFSIFFVASSDKPSVRLASGFVSQRICNAATSLNIGVCPLGGLNDTNSLFNAANIPEQSVLLHSILAGRLSQELDVTAAPLKKEVQLLSQDKGKYFANSSHD